MYQEIVPGLGGLVNGAAPYSARYKHAFNGLRLFIGRGGPCGLSNAASCVHRDDRGTFSICMGGVA